MRPLQIFFLTLIIIGIGLIFTRDKWVPKVVDYIMKDEVSRNQEIPEIPVKVCYKDLICVDVPKAGQVIQSPLRIAGEARGNWYFEASFPVTLVDWDGKIVAEGHAEAQGEWMTTEFVPFEGKLIFTRDSNSYSNKGTLILHKDNASGLPEHDDAIEIPILLK